MFAVFAMSFVFTAYNATTSNGESFDAVVVLKNGVKISTLSDYNESGLTKKDDALSGWFGDATGYHRVTIGGKTGEHRLKEYMRERRMEFPN